MYVVRRRGCEAGFSIGGASTTTGDHVHDNKTKIISREREITYIGIKGVNYSEHLLSFAIIVYRKSINLLAEYTGAA